MTYMMERQKGTGEWLSEEDAGGCFRALCEGVAYLHSHSIAHRDLKPENILLEKAGDLLSVRVCDFGFAKFLPKDGHLTQTGLGTFGYVAPEIISHRTSYDGMQCDLWSLGVILFILVSGDAPFKLGGATVADKNKVIMGKYVFDQRAWSGKSEYPKVVVRSLLQTQPKERMSAKNVLQQNWVANSGKVVSGWFPNANTDASAVTIVEGCTKTKKPPPSRVAKSAAEPQEPEAACTCTLQ